MKTLSAANQTNIAATFQDPWILVEIPSLGKNWQSKAGFAIHETRIVGLSPFRQVLPQRGGLGAFSDFTVTIQQETPTQFIQDLDADNVAVEVYLRYVTGASFDAPIPWTPFSH